MKTKQDNNNEQERLINYLGVDNIVCFTGYISSVFFLCYTPTSIQTRAIYGSFDKNIY